MRVGPVTFVVGCLLLAACAESRAADLHQVIRRAQAKVVKIYGAGGLRGMEAYQSGTLVSPVGHVLTATSYVLDTDDLVVVLDDGRKFAAEYVASDPILELTMLKIATEGETLPAFDYHSSAASRPEIGERVLALSNLFGIAGGNEPVSVLQGVVTSIAPLDARHGSYQANYRGAVLVVDAYANNPGAAGGALLDWNGNLVGILGKELRSQSTGTWLNYALPVGDLVVAIDNLVAGRSNEKIDQADLPDHPATLDGLGIVLVPDLLARTPPYADGVHRDSAADRAGLRPDDLIVFVANEPVVSCQALRQVLLRHDRALPLEFAVLRDGLLLTRTLEGGK